MIDRYNVFWMLSRIWYRLSRPLHWSEPVTVRTWHRGAHGAAMYRDFDLFVKGEPVGRRCPPGCWPTWTPTSCSG